VPAASLLGLTARRLPGRRYLVGSALELTPTDLLPRGLFPVGSERVAADVEVFGRPRTQWVSRLLQGLRDLGGLRIPWNRLDDRGCGGS